MNELENRMTRNLNKELMGIREKLGTHQTSFDKLLDIVTVDREDFKA